MTKNKPSFQFDNTFSVKKLSDNTPIDTLYSDGGHEKQLYNIGDKIVTQYNDVFKAGLIFTIQAVMENNGYFDYYYGGVWHKQNSFLKL